jgi:hypothetical protein
MKRKEFLLWLYYETSVINSSSTASNEWVLHATLTRFAGADFGCKTKRKENVNSLFNNELDSDI